MSTHLLLRRSTRLSPTSLSTTRLFSTTPSSRWGNKTQKQNLPGGKPQPKKWPKKTPRPLPNNTADLRSWKNEQERREYEEQEWQAASRNALLGAYIPESRAAPLLTPSAAPVGAGKPEKTNTSNVNAAAPRPPVRSANAGQPKKPNTSNVNAATAPRPSDAPVSAGQPEKPITSNAHAPAAPKPSAAPVDAEESKKPSSAPRPSAASVNAEQLEKPSASKADTPTAPKPSAGATNGGQAGGGPHSQKGPSRLGASRTVALIALAFANGATLATLWGAPQAVEYGEKEKFRTPKYAGVGEMEKAMNEVRKVLGREDSVSIDPDVLHMHGYSEWSSINTSVLPVAVVYPKSTQEVSEIAKICHKYKIPVIPYSGGTSLEANFSAPYGGFSIDFAYMDKIIKVNEADMDVVVQPSVPWMTLNENLASTGLFFPIDPGPSAQIGGMVGTNCSGTNAVRYGTMKSWVINLTVVLADGTIIKTKRRPRKSSAGYNLNELFTGSEGTLGLVTEITLKLAVIPEVTSVAVVPFPSIRAAASAAAGVARQGIPVAAMELMDEVQMKVVNLGGATRPRVWEEKPTLFFKFSGTAVNVKDNIARVKAIASKHQGGRFEFAKDATEQKLLWSARKESLWSMLALRKEGSEVWSTDVAVPFSKLADIIEISKKEMDDLGLFASIIGHIGDGNFHESIMYDSRVPGEKERVERCVKNMVHRALEMEGTCTGEHGVGLGKKEALLMEVGEKTLDVMKSVKLALDPYWLMNPGKVVDVPGFERFDKWSK